MPSAKQYLLWAKGGGWWDWVAAEVPNAARGDITDYAGDGQPRRQMQSSTTDFRQDKHPYGGV